MINESKWSGMSDAQLREEMRASWNFCIDSYGDERQKVVDQLYRLKAMLVERGQEAMWEEEFAAGKARLKQKREREQAARNLTTGATK